MLLYNWIFSWGLIFIFFVIQTHFINILTHEKLLPWVEFEQYRSKNESLSHKHQILMKTRKLDTMKISRYTVQYKTRLQYNNRRDI